MTAQEAYNILRRSYPLSKVRGCLDYGSFFVFCLVPINIPEGGTYYTGTVMDAVDKKNGMAFKYDLTDDVEAYERAKKVEVNDIFNTPIKGGD